MNVLYTSKVIVSLFQGR